MFNTKLILGGSFMTLSLSFAAHPQMGSPEHGIDRPGRDLRNFQATGWQECSSSCASQSQCRAYTFVNKTQTCWLKGSAPAGRKTNGVVSGIRIMSPIERGTDRPGHDLRAGFSSTNPYECQRSCQLSAKCEAWTWVKPNGRGEGACWLKDEVSAASKNDCCFSGVRLVVNPARVESVSDRQTKSGVNTNIVKVPKTPLVTQQASPDKKGQNPPDISQMPVYQGARDILQRTFLEVETAAGDHQNWGQIRTINQPTSLRFRWRTDYTNVVSARWKISGYARKNSEIVYKTGQVPTIPASGASAMFVFEMPPIDQLGGVGEYQVSLTPVSRMPDGNLLTLSPSTPVSIEYAQAAAGGSLDLLETVPIPEHWIGLPDMGHYCSVTDPSTGNWEFAWHGDDPCGIIKQNIAGGVIQHAGLYSISDENRVVLRCDNHLSTHRGVEQLPLMAARKKAYGRKNCIFTIAPKHLPIFQSPFNVTISGYAPGTGFDFARPPYNTLNVQDFGENGSTMATVVNNRGQERSAADFIDNHDSYDWGLPRQTPIYAVADGLVLKARFFDTGNTQSDSPVQGEIYIKHTVHGGKPWFPMYNEEFVSSYFHLASFGVVDGQVVKSGFFIGRSGNTGDSSGPHLHFATMRLTNTATQLSETLIIDSGGNSGWRLVIDPYGFDTNHGFDPWSTGAFGKGLGALSIDLWKPGEAPPMGNW